MADLVSMPATDHTSAARLPGCGLPSPAQIARAYGCSQVLCALRRRILSGRGSLKGRLHGVHNYFVVDRAPALRAAKVLVLKPRKGKRVEGDEWKDTGTDDLPLGGDDE